MEKVVVLVYMVFMFLVIRHNYNNMSDGMNNFPCRIITSHVLPCEGLTSVVALSRGLRDPDTYGMYASCARHPTALFQYDVCEKIDDKTRFMRSYLLDGVEYYNTSSANDWYTVESPYINAAYMYYMMFLILSTIQMVLSCGTAAVINYVL